MVSRAATEESVRVSPLRARLPSISLGLTRELVFRKREASSCEQQGACKTPFPASASVLHKRFPCSPLICG